MIDSMTMVKLAVSLPAEVAADARAAVAAGTASSVSALVAEALREHARRRTSMTILDRARRRGPVAGLDDPAALVRAIRDEHR